MSPALAVWVSSTFLSICHGRRPSTNRYYVDFASTQFALTGKVASSQTIAFVYIKATDDIESGTSPVWPARFHKLVAYIMAEFHQLGVDVDDINQVQGENQRKIAEKIMDPMVRWDGQLKNQAMNNSFFGRDTDVEIPLGEM